MWPLQGISRHVRRTGTTWCCRQVWILRVYFSGCCESRRTSQAFGFHILVGFALLESVRGNKVVSWLAEEVLDCNYSQSIVLQSHWQSVLHRDIWPCPHRFERLRRRSRLKQTACGTIFQLCRKKPCERHYSKSKPNVTGALQEKNAKLLSCSLMLLDNSSNKIPATFHA